MPALPNVPVLRNTVRENALNKIKAYIQTIKYNILIYNILKIHIL
jgi:hypothetical protein